VTVKDLFVRLVTALDSAGVPYMLVGSFASSAHGIPRATKDIDIVIAPTSEQLAHLIEHFPATNYHAVLEEATFAFEHRSMFNVMDYETGWRVDFIVQKESEFAASEFRRRRQIDLAGATLYVASPEDVLIAKLDWAKQGGSDRQLEDAAAIISTQGEDLDAQYVEQWVDTLGLHAQWRAAREIAV
jgi:hypothetical protein